MHGYITPCKTAKSIIEYSVSIMLKNKDKKLAKAFNFSFRYIDNILSLNNTLFGALSEMMGTLLFAYLRWRRRDVCNFHMIYIDDIIHSCMCVIF